MERQIAQMAEDQRKRDNGKLPSTTEVNPTHAQRAGKEHVNAVEAEWRKVTLEDLLESESEVESEKEEIKTESESKQEEDVKEEVKIEVEEVHVEKEPQLQEDKEVQKEDQPMVAGIKQRKKDKKEKKTQEVPVKSAGPSINQPLWDELKDAPEDTRILQEMCRSNKEGKTPTPETVRNTLLDLGASVNVLSGYLYDKYKNEELEPAKTVLQLADQSTKDSRGKLINVIVKVGDFFYPVYFLVMEYESLEDAPTLILGRPFLATAGAVMDCKTRDLDISFGTRRRRLNMFGCPISVPSGKNDKYLNDNPLMAPGTKDRLLDMMELMEMKHQRYEKDARCREAKVFQLLDAQQQWISQVKISEMGFVIRNSGSPRRALVLGPRRGSMAFRRDHPFLQFPEGLDSSEEYVSRKEALISRRVLEATIIDRDNLRDAGLWAEIEPFLHRTWVDGEATFTCRGWDRLMANQEDVVYTEILLEFLSTVRYAPGSSEAWSKLVRFRLGGVPRECSLRSLGGARAFTRRRTSRADTSRRFFTRALRGSPHGMPMLPFGPRCPTYTLRRGRPGRASSATRFTGSCTASSPVLYSRGRGGEKVSGEDMTYMWVLLDPSRFLHLPYALAISLSTRAAGQSASSPLAGGHYITRLARSYRLLTTANIATLSAILPVRTTARSLENMGLIEQPRPGHYVRVATEAPQAPQPTYAQPGRRRRRPAAPVEPEPQPQLSDVLAAIQDLSQRMSAREAHDRWMVETQRMIMLWMQIDDIPPHPSGGDDMAGPSGTRHDDE
ncbi:hypothetical protein L1887_24112 [Cichorium endivia]|nr:hypothetical protein L1887_24112 [Cichorium endivia]